MTDRLKDFLESLTNKILDATSYLQLTNLIEIELTNMYGMGYDDGVMDTSQLLT